MHFGSGFFVSHLIRHEKKSISGIKGGTDIEEPVGSAPDPRNSQEWEKCGNVCVFLFAKKIPEKERPPVRIRAYSRSTEGICNWIWFLMKKNALEKETSAFSFFDGIPFFPFSAKHFSNLNLWEAARISKVLSQGNVATETATTTEK